MVTIPTLFSGTVACIASGPSLTDADVEYCRGKVGVICINDVYRKAPWGDVLYGADLRWWEYHKGAPSFQGLKVSIGNHAQSATTRFSTKFPDVLLVQNAGTSKGKIGLETQHPGVRVGRIPGDSHSGYQAINLAWHLGARRVLLLGYDCQPDASGKRHFFGNHPRGLMQTSRGQFELWARSYDSLMAAARTVGLELLNCSRSTAITAIPRADLQQAIGQAVAA